MAQVDAAIGEAYQDVRSDSSGTQWSVFGYDKKEKNKIVLQAKGAGDFNCFTENFKDDEAQYGFAWVVLGDEESKRAKFIFVSWIGKRVGVLQKAKVSVHKASVKEVCPRLCC